MGHCDTTFSVLRFSRFGGEANLENGGPRHLSQTGDQQNKTLIQFLSGTK